MDEAIGRYKAGEEEVSWAAGPLMISLRNLKDNADREVVRFTLAEYREMAVALISYGAARAGGLIAHSVADQFGLLDDVEE